MASKLSLLRVKRLFAFSVLLLAVVSQLPAADAIAPPLGARNTNAVSSGPAASTNQPNLTATNTLDDRLRLGVGDRLSYRIVEDLEEAKPLVVTDSGDIEVP